MSFEATITMFAVFAIIILILGLLINPYKGDD